MLSLIMFNDEPATEYIEGEGPIVVILIFCVGMQSPSSAIAQDISQLISNMSRVWLLLIIL
jgi:hypothetical protein